jgi:hypothetical protein
MSKLPAWVGTGALIGHRRREPLLSQPFTPPYYVTLDTPFWFLELPQNDLSILQDWGITPGWSWVTARLDSDQSPNDGYWTGTTFQYYFPWENPSDNYTVVNVSSSLYLRGAAGATGSWGLLSQNHAYLDVTAELSVIRWSGWGTDPDTGQSNDQTGYPGAFSATTVADLDGFGGNVFASEQNAQATFSVLNPYDAQPPEPVQQRDRLLDHHVPSRGGRSPG